MAQSTAEQFKPFCILNQDAVDFLKNSSEKFDIIFMSHVFEHFSIEDGIDLAKLIRAHLSDD
jgi:predicted SAM-dependent methyltransferase